MGYRHFKQVRPPRGYEQGRNGIWREFLRIGLNYTGCGATVTWSHFFMRCPFCHVDNDRVIDTRATEDGYVVRRKRVCGTCHRKFTTLERLEEANVRVVKRDQTREPLDREKIRRGIERACSKRPISSQQIETIVQEIEGEIYLSADLEVPTSRIGEIVMRHLARADEVAYIRFASVYREFEDARDFFNAIEKFRSSDASI